MSPKAMPSREWLPTGPPKPVLDDDRPIPWAWIIDSAGILELTGWTTRPAIDHAIQARKFPKHQWTLPGGQRLWDRRAVEAWIDLCLVPARQMRAAARARTD